MKDKEAHYVIFIKKKKFDKLRSLDDVLRRDILASNSRTIYIHFVGPLRRPYHLYFLRKLISENIMHTIIIDSNESLEHIIEKVRDKSYKIIEV